MPYFHCTIKRKKINLLNLDSLTEINEYNFLIDIQLLVTKKLKLSISLEIVFQNPTMKPQDNDYI